MNFNRFSRNIICLLFLTLFAGCIKLDLTLTLSREGSAIVMANYSIPKQTISNLNTMLNVKKKLTVFTENPAGEDFTEEFLKLVLNSSETEIKQEFTNFGKYGITLNYLSVDITGDQRYVRCEFTVTNIANLAKIPLLLNSALSLTKEPDGNYSLFHPELAKLINSESSDIISEDARVPLLERFKLSIRVNCPTPILKTNAHRKSQTSALWVFDSDNDPSAFRTFHRQQFYIKFVGTGLKLPELKFAESSSHRN